MIPICKPTIGKEEITSVNEVLQSGNLSCGGVTAKFERRFADYIGSKYAIAVSSGTSALHCAYLACNLKPQETNAITTPLTFNATVNMLKAVNLDIKYIDVCDDFNINETQMYSRRNSYDKLIVPVHLYGLACEMDIIMDIAKKNNSMIVEDCAQACGAEYNGKKVGTFGDVGCFSFYGSKILTSCFPPNIPILIKPPTGKKGLSRQKKIQDLNIGDIVLTYNQITSEKEYQPILNIFKREYKDKLINIELSNLNDLKATPNHKIYVVNKGWVRFDNLKMGDEIIQYKMRGLKNKTLQKGKTYDELYGSDKATQLKKNLSIKFSGDKHPLYGIPCSEERKRNIGKANKGKTRTEEVKNRLSNSQKERWDNMPKEQRNEFKLKMKKIENDPIINLKRSNTLKKIYENPINREKCRVRMLNLLNNHKDYRTKLSNGVKKAMMKDSYWVNYFKGVNYKINKQELFLSNFINTHFPNEFSFNGDFSLKIHINRLIPDFVNINGKKKLIEFFGSHWHKPKEEQIVKNRYQQAGYECLVIWDKELNNLNILKEKIKTYIYNPNIEIVKITKIEEEEYEGYVYNIETEKNHNYFPKGILVHNCGEGGMCVTDNIEIADKIRDLRQHSLNQGGIGYNYRMTDVSAAFGIEQLKKIDTFIEKRQKIASIYNDEFNGLIKKLPIEKGHIYNSYSFCIKNRDKFIIDMDRLGVMCRVYYPEPFTDLPNVSRICKEVVSIPMYPTLKDEEISYIIDCVKKSLKLT